MISIHERNYLLMKIIKRVFLVMLVFSVLSSGLAVTATEAAAEARSFKVLAIGNSFSEDGMAHLYEVATKGGFENVKLGNLYIAGCSLQTHWTNAQGNRNAYAFNTNSDGSWKTQASTSILTALKSDNWDYIIFQQVSTNSGLPATYEPYLGNLIDYVKENNENKDTKYAWHMTWAYAKTSTHAGFANYDKDQDKMYNAILETAKTSVMEKYSDKIDILIPSGTTIQNMRSSYFDDAAMTSDGYHLSHQLGRLGAAMTWFKALTGEPIDDIYTEIASQKSQMVIKEAVNNAVKTPYAVTESTYKTEPEDNFNPDGYTLFDWEPVAFSYWNSTSTDKYYTATNVELNKRFLCSGRKLTKEDIPVGSVIVIENGYQYRPEKWPATGLVTGTRAGNVTEKITNVTEGWWADWTYVTFNLSKLDNTNISENPDEHKSALKIYIPKGDQTPYSGEVTAPELEEKTSTSVLLKTEAGFEYSKDGTNWQDSGSFTNLNPDTDYSFYRRAKETATVFASEASPALTVRTEKADESSAESADESKSTVKENNNNWIYALAGVAVITVAAVAIIGKKKKK